MSELPLKKTTQGKSIIETRPLYIEEWLDTLPYVDFNKTSLLLHKALVKTNKTDIKPATRLELITLYNVPYQYYIESQIKTGTWHTLQTIDAVRAQISPMLQIALDLSYGCELAVKAMLNQKIRWKRTKPPIEGMLMFMNYLSHVLIFSFLGYSLVPKQLWHQLHRIYDFAESLNYHKKKYSILGADNNVKTTVEHAYKRIMLASLVDPHHLPFGAIWEIYEQLDSWAEQAQIEGMQSISNSVGYFVFDLRSDNKPIPYQKFNKQDTNDKIRLLKTIPLQGLIQKQIDLLQNGKQLDETIVLSSFYAKPLLIYMLKAWSIPPKRYFPRNEKSGNMNIISGINTLYYVLNDGRVFQKVALEEDGIILEEEDAMTSEEISEDPAFVTLQGYSPMMMKRKGDLSPEDNDGLLSLKDAKTLEVQIDSVKESDHKNNVPLKINYIPESWRIVDESTGGYALVKKGKLKKTLRVGDLIGSNLGGSNKDWTIGIVRWLIVGREIYKMGLQSIAHTAKPIALRACYGSSADREFRPAFLVSQPNNAKNVSIVAEKGLYSSEREMEIIIDDNTQGIIANILIESGIICEIFNYKTH